MADGCVQCVVTSPPYWGLRDYGNPPRVWGGEVGCEHVWMDTVHYAGGGQPDEKVRWQHTGKGPSGHPKVRTGFCQHCNAWRGCLGLEPTPELYVAHLVEGFREVKRVLRDDGTVWLNMGDSYWSNTLVRGTGLRKVRVAMRKNLPAYGSFYKGRPPGLKPKDLCGIPWRVAFALQADGWWLRSDIIWHKPNCMPESVRDRPTKAHEYVFLLSKSKRYYYDQDAVREGLKEATIKREESGYNHAFASQFKGSPTDKRHVDGKQVERVSNPAGRNRRTVWTIATQPYSGAHFAVFPEKLVEPCIKAGTSERGACPECGAGWVRVVERKSLKRNELPRDHEHYRPGFYTDGKAGDFQSPGPGQAIVEVSTIGWQPTCACDAGEPVPCIVFDPFMGAGTTALVALKLGRQFYGAEINPEYVRLAEERLMGAQMEMGL